MAKKNTSFDDYSKKPLKEEVRKAMNRYYQQLDTNMPIDVYKLVLDEVEPPLLIATMKFVNQKQPFSKRGLEECFFSQLVCF